MNKMSMGGARNKKKSQVKIVETVNKKKKVIYFGHENWNIMLNMMLGIRKSLKSHLEKYHSEVVFT
jgi:hypothetical protein